MKHLLLGDEAIALGAIDAGLSGVYAYPGTPSTEITEYIQSAAVTAVSVGCAAGVTPVSVGCAAAELRAMALNLINRNK